MKKRKLRNVLVIMLVTSVLFGTSPSAIACLVAVDVTLPASECECFDTDPNGSSWEAFWDWLTANGYCDGYQHSSITYTGSSRSAVSGESGYGSLTFTSSQVGTKYPCIGDMDEIAYAACLVGAAACGLACGTTWIGCACVPLLLETCNYCTWTDCVGDTNNPQPINKFVLSGVACPCTG